ncbi:MAG: mechanosensitive ion channel family protein [bacterium]
MLRLFLAQLFSLFVLVSFNLSAATDPYVEAKIKTGITGLDSAPVVVNGKELFSIIGVKSFPAKERARLFEDRIEAIAEDPDANPEEIELVEEKHWTEIKFRGNRILSVLDADAQNLGLQERSVIASAYRTRIVEAVHEYRADRTPEQLKQDLIKAAIRTLALIVTLYLTLRLFKLLDSFVERFFARRLRRLEAKSMRVIQSEHISKAICMVIRLLKFTVIIALVYVFLHYVLELFPWTRYFAHRLMVLAIDPIKALASGFIGYLPSLFFLVILYFVTRYILKLVKSFFDAIHYENIRLKDFDSEWAIPTYRIIRIVVVVFAVVIAYPYIPGSSSEAFKGVSIFMGVLLSLGSTSVISNIIAGYTMTYRRAFKVGDRVKIGETVGDVIEARLLVTHVNSLKNEKIVIPNSTILNSEVINYSALAKDKDLLLHTQVGIGYEVPWRQVEAMLIEAANRTEGLAKQPEPFVLQKALADFAVIYELNVYCKHPGKMMALYSSLHANIQDVFNEHEVQIMTPNYVADTPEPKIVARENWHMAPAKEPEGETSV